MACSRAFAKHGGEGARAVIAQLQRHRCHRVTGSQPGHRIKKTGLASPFCKRHSGLRAKEPAEAAFTLVQLLCPGQWRQAHVGLVKKAMHKVASRSSRGTGAKNGNAAARPTSSSKSDISAPSRPRSSYNAGKSIASISSCRSKGTRPAPRNAIGFLVPRQARCRGFGIDSHHLHPVRLACWNPHPTVWRYHQAPSSVLTSINPVAP